MAYIQTIGDRVEVKLYGTNEGQQYSINTLHAKCATLAAGGPASLQDIATAFSGYLNTDYKALLSEDAELIGVGIRIIRPLPQTLEVVSTIDAGSGGQTGDVLPGIVAGLLALKTDIAGPRYRGRLFLPWPSEACNEDPGQPTPAYVTALGNFGSLLLGTPAIISTAGKSVGTWEFGVYHRDDGSTTPITHVAARSYWSQHVTRAGIRRPDRPPF